MKNILLLIAMIIAYLAMIDVHAQTQNDSLGTRLQSVFGDNQVEVRDYDDQLKEVIVGSSYFFTTHDGRYVFAGRIMDTHRKVDIVAERDDLRRRTVLDSQPEELFVSYPSVGTAKHRVTIFTDIDCPYCRKLHNTMNTLNQRGIDVNYVMLPRTGVGSASYVKTMNAFCSDNPAESITRAMQGDDPAPAICESNPLTAQMQLARELGIVSTPTIVLPNGELQVGLLSPDQLVALLQGEN